MLHVISENSCYVKHLSIYVPLFPGQIVKYDVPNGERCVVEDEIVDPG